MPIEGRLYTHKSIRGFCREKVYEKSYNRNFHYRIPNANLWMPQSFKQVFIEASEIDKQLVNYALSENGGAIYVSQDNSDHPASTLTNGVVGSENWNQGEGWESQFDGEYEYGGYIEPGEREQLAVFSRGRRRNTSARGYKSDRLQKRRPLRRWDRWHRFFGVRMGCYSTRKGRTGNPCHCPHRRFRKISRQSVRYQRFYCTILDTTRKQLEERRSNREKNWRATQQHP